MIQNRRRELPICSSLPQALRASENRAVLRLLGYTPVGVFIETTQRCLACAVKEGFVDLASTSTALLINTKFCMVPWAFAKLCDSGAASLRRGGGGERTSSQQGEFVGYNFREMCCLKFGSSDF